MPLHDPLQAVVATVVEIPPEEVQSSQTRLTLSTPPEPVIPIMLGLANHMKGTFPGNYFKIYIHTYIHS